MARHAIDDARQPSGRWGWAALRQTLALWRHRARARAELRRIPDHLFKDLPFDAEMVLSERDKPFWKE